MKSTYFENKKDSLSGFWAVNQEASEPLPCPVPSPSAVGMLGRSESPWARSAYGRILPIPDSAAVSRKNPKLLIFNPPGPMFRKRFLETEKIFLNKN